MHKIIKISWCKENTIHFQKRYVVAYYKLHNFFIPFYTIQLLSETIFSKIPQFSDIRLSKIKEILYVILIEQS